MLHHTTDEPIYALATAYLPSALAVIRLSGTASIALFQRAFSADLSKRKNSTAVHGFIKAEDGSFIDEVMVIIYKKGHGYTGEEAVEIMSHGSLPLIDRISSRLEEIGFRKALGGEFTYRAFMHGRMDLTEAEAVEEIIKAKSERAGHSALSRLTGSLLSEVNNLKGEILEILASLEVYLDYGEDEIIDEWVFPHERVKRIYDRLTQIASTYSSTRLFTDGATVVLAGATNAGKSSLFNALLKENRAIVSPIAGTTRDYIEAEILIGNIPVHLYDTAGLRVGEDEIESEGIRRSERLIDEADLRVFVLDGSESIERRLDRAIYVSSKSDLSSAHDSGAIAFSSLTGEGLSAVTSAIGSALIGSLGENSGGVEIASERQRERITAAAEQLKMAEEASALSVDLIAIYFEAALRELGELTGEVTNDDLLDVLFSKFCLGK